MYQMATYVHGLFAENTCNRVSWIWGCKQQSDTMRTAGNVRMAAQTVMGTWLTAAIFFGVCVTPGATHNITNNGARMGILAIFPIAGHTMRSVSRTPMKDKALKLEAPSDSAKWSMRDFRRYLVSAIWKQCVSVLMSVTGQRTVRAADYQRQHFLQEDLAWHRRDISLTRAAQRRVFETEIFSRIYGHCMFQHVWLGSQESNISHIRLIYTFLSRILMAQ